MPVQKSDVLTIPDEGEWQITPVCWRSRFKEYNKNYFRIEFVNTRGSQHRKWETRCMKLTIFTDDEPEKTNYLFVSEEKVEDFKTSKIEKADTGFKLRVDDDYMFGQQKGGRARFLVYHDKEREIMQVSTRDLLTGLQS